MTLFQTAQSNPYKQTIQSGPNAPIVGEHYHNPSLIDQLHDDPTPFIEDSFISSSANPEEILMAKEALLHEYTWNDHISEYMEQEINEEADGIFEAIAPTTTNLPDFITTVHLLQDGTTLIIKRRPQSFYINPITRRA